MISPLATPESDQRNMDRTSTHYTRLSLEAITPSWLIYMSVF